MSQAQFGLIKTTLLDYPGLVAAVVFTSGCNLRCPWCHNPGLVQPPWDPDMIDRTQLMDFLKKRRSVLQGVVITGGEPLLQSDLPLLIQEIHQLGYQIKLDTNGTWPQRLAAIPAEQIDYLAMDIKNVLSRYGLSVGMDIDSAKIVASLELVKQRRPGTSELRLTWVPTLNRIEDLADLASLVGSELPLYIQAYRPGAVLDPAFASVRAPTTDELHQVVQQLQQGGVRAQWRS